jgi:hypothetical protein
MRKRKPTIADSKSAFPSKLNDIASYSAKPIHYVSIALTIDVNYSASNMLCNSFRSDAIPALLINFDSSIEFAEKIVPVFEEFLDISILRFVCLLIHKIVSL